MTKSKWMTTGLLAGLVLATPLMAADEIVIKPYRTGDERRVDNPVDAIMNAFAGPAGKEVPGVTPRPGRSINTRDTLSDDSKHGDFAITFTVEDPAKQSAFGMSCGEYIDCWEVGPKAKLHLWLKFTAAGDYDPLYVSLYDAAGKFASLRLDPQPKPGQWVELDLKLSKFEVRQKGFDFNALRSVQLEGALPKGAQVWLDDVYFHEGKTHLGVTDKTITQYMEETAATRPARVEEAIAQAAKKWKGQSAMQSAFRHGEVEEGNRVLSEILAGDPRKLNLTGMRQLYLQYGPRGTVRPNAIDTKNKAAILEKLHPLDALQNDIAIARASTWFVSHSENLDYVKRRLMFNSQIFMHEPEYADRVYPNVGTTLGFRREDTWLHWIKTWSYAETERGNYSDGKKYTPQDHYKAWVEYWKRYMAERARYGYFAENNANGAYGNIHVMNYYYIFAYSEDEALREQARMFLDLSFAKHLQDQILLTQGGPMGRGKLGSFKNVTPQFAWAFLGGSGQRITQFDGYAWPRVLWEMALDRKGRGEYAYVARGPNEANPIDPRPEGTDTVELFRPDSRIVRYSWVTPDYVMGTRMDHPRALYQHCVRGDQGIVFPTSPQATIKPEFGKVYMSVQDKSVAILLPRRYVMIQHPPRFPVQPVMASNVQPLKLMIGRDVDRVEEKDGWVFIEEGDAYGAFRFVSTTSKEHTARDEFGMPIYPVDTDNYTIETVEQGKKGGPSKGDHLMTAKEAYVPLVMEMSRKAHHPTFEDFQKDVLDNPLQFKSNNVRFGFLISYKGCREDAHELEMNGYNDQTPRIDGAYMTYDSPAFDSPWLKGPFGSGVVTLTGPISGEKLVLDFNERSPEKEAHAFLKGEKQ
jgi:hypothetical protein